MKKQMSPPAKKPRRFDDSQTIPRRSSRLSASDEFSSKIPVDLIIEIFSRLPLKSIATCRCVSKRWASILRRSDFTELFLEKSLARPQLLFTCRKGRDVLFFSSPQPQNFGENLFPMPTTVDHHVRFPVEHACHISSPLNGVVCISDARILKRRKTREIVSVICNPSTRQSFILPKMKTRKRTGLRSFSGYDPVEKQHKVLAMIRQKNGAEMHQVLTLGNGRLTWRMVECGISHSFPERECVCINGVLYYIARVSNLVDMIVCFDVRSEKFSFVNLMEVGKYDAVLINFQGKLASVRSSATTFLSGRSTSLEMWILEDTEEHEWSKRIFNLPPMRTEGAAGEVLDFVGVTAANEFVVSPCFPSDPFYVYYYNFVKDYISRVEIQGMGAFDQITSCRMRIYVNHVEDVKLMELF